MGRGLVGDFQFHAAVDDIGGQAVQFLDLHIAATLTEVLDGNIPESITLDHGMYPITRLGGISGFQVGCLHRGQARPLPEGSVINSIPLRQEKVSP